MPLEIRSLPAKLIHEIRYLNAARRGGTERAGRNAAGAATLLALALGCARARDPSPVTRAAPCPTIAVGQPDAAAPDAATPSLPPFAFLGQQAESDHFGDPARLFFARVQTPPAGFRALPTDTTRPFPGARYAEARAFNVGFGEAFVGQPSCMLLAPDGTLCPSVTAPGVRLSPEQTARVATLLGSGLSNDGLSRGVDGGEYRVGRFRTRCGFQPTMAIVFYDAASRPTATVEVCFGCSEILARPSLLGDEPAGMWPEERAFFQSFCRELGLGGCGDGGDAGDAWNEARTWSGMPAWNAVRLTHALATAPPVPGDRVMADTTPVERRALCAWHARVRDRFSATLPRYRSADGSWGYRCEDGRAYSVQDAAMCLAQFPSCRATVNEAMRCLRERYPDVCAPLSAECAPERACRFGWVDGPQQ